MFKRTVRGLRSRDLIVASLLSAVFLAPMTPPAALALSELKPAGAPETNPDQLPGLPPLEEPQSGPDGGLPDPDPVIRDIEETEVPSSPTRPATIATDGPLPEVLTDLTQLPEPVARMRELIVEAAASGDPERLRALLGVGPSATQLAAGAVDGDPVGYLRAISGDGEGQEILAILIDLLNAGFVRLDAGKATETFVWPFFAAVPLETLTPPQRVELLRIVTAGDVEDMKAYGGYNFFRVGISADGAWRFFMAGD